MENKENKEQQTTIVEIQTIEKNDTELKLIDSFEVENICIKDRIARENLIRMGIIGIYRNKGINADGIYLLNIFDNSITLNSIVIIEENKPTVLGIVNI